MYRTPRTRRLDAIKTPKANAITVLTRIVFLKPILEFATNKLSHIGTFQLVHTAWRETMLKYFDEKVLQKLPWLTLFVENGFVGISPHWLGILEENSFIGSSFNWLVIHGQIKFLTFVVKNYPQQCYKKEKIIELLMINPQNGKIWSMEQKCPQTGKICSIHQNKLMMILENRPENFCFENFVCSYGTHFLQIISKFCKINEIQLDLRKIVIKPRGVTAEHMEILLDHGAKVDDVIHYLTGIDLTSKNSKGVSMLHMMIHPSLMQHFINEKNSDGNTPLHRVMGSYCCEPNIKILLENGADPNICNNRGQTILDRVLSENGYVMVKKHGGLLASELPN